MMQKYKIEFDILFQQCTYEKKCQTKHRQKCSEIPFEKCDPVEKCQQMPYEKCQTIVDKDCTKVITFKVAIELFRYK